MCHIDSKGTCLLHHMCNSKPVALFSCQDVTSMGSGTGLSYGVWGNDPHSGHRPLKQGLVVVVSMPIMEALLGYRHELGLG